MMDRQHAVLLHGSPIGVIHHRGDFARFSFLEDYWDRPGRPVLGLWFEDHPGLSPQAALRLPPWFSNLLPEGKLRTWIARDRRVAVDRELELLLQVGHDLPGAVEVIADAGNRPHEDWSVTDAYFAEVTEDRPWKFSLAGVGLKFSMLRAEDRLTIPASFENGDWIVKMPAADHPGVPRNEFAMMSLAKQVGIDTPRILLIHREELPALPGAVWPGKEDLAYAVERFDRSAGGTNRIHIEDFAQVREFYPEQKYDGSFETVAALAFRGHDEAALIEFVRRLVLNVLVGNGDAHLKNWSLIYRDPGSPTLSPVYDVVSTEGYIGEGEDLGMKFARSRSLDSVNLASFDRLARKLDVDLGLSEVARATAELVAEHWEGTVSEPELDGVRQSISSHIEPRLRNLGVQGV
ncbi:serine/threonine-protein kinase HipA [Curtobacterium herbarum]|uniref:type II toxin-antitoxin system HipA family toxin n=1 Tax=Curtobacterium herbarum TaxID=150122 RepID=UPI00209D85E0|nr:HipA domain-containing protein [Curtobacterium herbarum]MCP1501409.1 serine/threonine-protein kinase HipA [Curtobacterium herbarum]